MYDILSTRELAIVIWSTILFLCLLFSTSIRNALLGVVKAACTPKLIIPFLCILAYTAFIIFRLTIIPGWKWIYLKDFLIWVFFVGVPVCYNSVCNDIDEHYFRNILFDNIKFIVLVEFVISTFTFNILVELLMIPTATFLLLLDAIAGTKFGFSLVKILTSSLQVFTGFAVMVSAIIMAINTYAVYGTIDLLVSFATPIVFSVLFIPCSFLFAIYAKYEMLFIRMRCKSSNSKKICLKQKIAVFEACGLSFKRVARFEKAYIKSMYALKEEAMLDDFIEVFKREANKK